MRYYLLSNGRVELRNKKPKNSVGEVPPNILAEDYPYLQVTQANDEYGRPIQQIGVDSIAKTAGDGMQQKTISLQNAYDTMNADVYDKLYDVFRTRKPEIATAEYETWKEMVLTPAAYASSGLKCDHQLNNADDTELFSPGSALDTAQKITDFASRKIEQAKEYGVYRAVRKQQFKDAVEAIENT